MTTLHNAHECLQQQCSYIHIGIKQYININDIFYILGLAY
jgi:hypothetical protein